MNFCVEVNAEILTVSVCAGLPTCLRFSQTKLSRNTNVVAEIASCENLCFGGAAHRLQTPTTYYRRSRRWTDFWNDL